MGQRCNANYWKKKVLFFKLTDHWIWQFTAGFLLKPGGRTVYKLTTVQSKGLNAPAFKQAVIACWLRNDLPRAAALARRWTTDEPDCLEAWVVLAETTTRQKHPDEALEALKIAARIDGNHPLFWRTFCQAALQAGAFYAAHGAVAAARYTNMQPDMLAELELWLRTGGLVDTKGHLVETILRGSGQLREESASISAQ